MNAKRDDDALNWAGDDDPTLTSGSTDRAGLEPVGLPEGWTIPQVSADHPVAPDTTTDADTPEPDSAQPGSAQPDSPAVGSAALVGMGILAGIYLLYSIGWFIGAARLSSQTMVVSTADPVAEFMTSLGGWLAVAAPLVWFGSTFWLTMSRPRARWFFLLLGVVVLIPFPFLVGSGQPL
ncbi:DNA polymerase III subunit gamma/tau [Cryobacterium glaciale]|uniref:DNA polymerase III subunit gamma/tau n=1 Tax=Cryobacterium glaciale TaxID=1259145 RepID=A0A4R8UPJ5_9MICO|nr:DNA polymerase III subunit gamma/tau [Cryobacterium glaciale]TFB69088.1 DNA polymerase III subunit gamma/tau [Cryobacterium glaciale]